MAGLTPLGISALLKCTPTRWVDRFKMKLVDENKDVGENRMLKTFNDVSSKQIGGKGADDDYTKVAQEEKK